MADTSLLESYLNSKSCKDGDVVVIVGGGVIELKEDLQTKRKFNTLSLPVQLNGHDLTYSPNKTALAVFQKAFGMNSDNYVGKKFIVKTYPTPKGIAILPQLVE